jgi:uncharacterized protein
MTVCLDTNVFLQIFGRRQPYHAILRALLDGKITLARLHGNIRELEPQFRFQVIQDDVDDNKFCDCAIAAEADFVVTSDGHFDALKTAGHRPKPISPEDFIRLHLQS